MEQRTAERKVVAFDAVVSCPRFGLIRGRIVELGMRGLYVRAETSIVPIGVTVTVTFQPGSDICEQCLTIEGYVRHQSLQGFGIEFAGLDAQCRQALEGLLPQMPRVPERAIPVLRAL